MIAPSLNIAHSAVTKKQRGELCMFYSSTDTSHETQPQVPVMDYRMSQLGLFEIFRRKFAILTFNWQESTRDITLLVTEKKPFVFQTAATYVFVSCEYKWHNH